MQQNNKKYFWNIVLIIGVAIVAMYFSLRDNFDEIVHAISSMNPLWLIVVLSWGFAINLVIGFGFMLLGRHTKPDYSLREGIVVAFVGTFFSGITPSSTGGQIGQAYVLKKQGISYKDGASLLWADFIIYQTTMMIYVTVLFVLRFSHYVNLNAWFWIVAAGYLVNVVVILALYTIVLFPGLYVKLSGILARALGRMHIVRDPQKTVASWTERVNGFTQESQKLSSNKMLILRMVLVNTVRLTLYFSLPYVCASALGIRLGPSAFVDMLALSSFVTMANCFVPLPGASGGTEVFFTMLFQDLLGKLTGAVLLLWRFSSYYIPMLAGAGVFLWFKNREDSKEFKLSASQAAALSSQGAPQPSAVDSAVPASSGRTSKK